MADKKEGVKKVTKKVGKKRTTKKTDPKGSFIKVLNTLAEKLSATNSEDKLHIFLVWNEQDKEGAAITGFAHGDPAGIATAINTVLDKAPELVLALRDDMAKKTGADKVEDIQKLLKSMLGA